MRDKGQLFIFNDNELSLIKAVFADNEELLYAIRNVLLQFETTDTQKKLVRAMVNDEVYTILKKRIFPDASPDAPWGQVADLYQTLSEGLKTKSVDDMEPLMDAKELEVDYLKQQFAVLKDFDAPQTIKLEDLKVMKGKSAYKRFVDTTARNYLLGFIDPMLILLKGIAGQKTESVAEVKKRMTRDSSK